MNSVKFKFNKRARIHVPTVLTDDMLMELCLQSGVDDYELHCEVDGGNLSPVEVGHSLVYVDMKDMGIMRDALIAKNFPVVESSLVSVPIDGYVTLSDADFESNMNAIDALEDLDDVDAVEHNINMKTTTE